MAVDGQPIEIDVEDALVSGQVAGAVLACPLNERPLGGLAGRLDWWFRGALSKGIRSGFITGKEGEIVYMPMKHQDRVIHLFLAGVGHTKSAGVRSMPPVETLNALKKNLSSLKPGLIALSRTDLGVRSGSDLATLRSAFKGSSELEVCIVK
jgi:hypothetical protein